MKTSPRHPILAFTLIELLTVMVIISILAGLVISIIGNVTSSAKKSRASGDIAGLQLALTRFQVDNGFYPTGTNISIITTGPNLHAYSPNPATNTYKIASRALFVALTGRSMYNYSSATNTNAGRQYIELRASQIGDAGLANADPNLDPTVANTYATNGFSTGSYIIDPFQNPVGYYYNPSGWNTTGDMSLYNTTVPDLWSTAGESTGSNVSQSYILLRWVHNWTQNSPP